MFFMCWIQREAGWHMFCNWNIMRLKRTPILIYIHVLEWYIIYWYITCRYWSYRWNQLRNGDWDKWMLHVKKTNIVPDFHWLTSVMSTLAICSPNAPHKSEQEVSAVCISTHLSDSLMFYHTTKVCTWLSLPPTPSLSYLPRDIRFV